MCICHYVCQSTYLVPVTVRLSLTAVLRSPLPLPLSVARDSSGGVAICYVFSVLWMMSRLHRSKRREKRRMPMLKVTNHVEVHGFDGVAYAETDPPGSSTGRGRSLISTTAWLPSCGTVQVELLRFCDWNAAQVSQRNVVTRRRRHFNELRFLQSTVAQAGGSASQERRVAASSNRPTAVSRLS